MKSLILSSLAILLILGILSACNKDSNPAGPGAISPVVNRSGAFVINEGNFGQGTASIDFYDSDASQYYPGVFATVNGVILGDVANSLAIVDTLGFIVVNNSHKIEVISINTFRRLRTIELPVSASPRNLAVAGNLGLVTALYKNSVYVLDLNTYQLVDSVAVGGNPETLMITNGTAYVVNSGLGNGHTVSYFTAELRSPVATIGVGENPQWIGEDSAGRIQVLCGGAYNDYSDPDDDTPGGIWVIDPQNNTVIDSLVLVAGDHPSELALSTDGIGYFLYNGAVVSYNTGSLEIINHGLISGFFYSISVDPTTQELYILDAKDFVSAGELLIYAADGVEKARYSTGIIPGYVAFVRR